MWKRFGIFDSSTSSHRLRPSRPISRWSPTAAWPSSGGTTADANLATWWEFTEKDTRNSKCLFYFDKIIGASFMLPWSGKSKAFILKINRPGQWLRDYRFYLPRLGWFYWLPKWKKVSVSKCSNKRSLSKVMFYFYKEKYPEPFYRIEFYSIAVINCAKKWKAVISPGFGLFIEYVNFSFIDVLLHIFWGKNLLGCLPYCQCMQSA